MPITRRRKSSRRRRPGVARGTASYGFVGKEVKHFDTWLPSTALNASAVALTGGEYPVSKLGNSDTAATCMTNPIQSNTEQGRDGKRIMAVSLEISGYISVPTKDDSTMLTTPTKIMIGVVLDKQANGLQAQSEAIWVNPADTGASANVQLSPHMFKNLAYGRKHQILRQKMYTLVPQTVYEGTDSTFEFSGVWKAFHFKIPLNGLIMNFNAVSPSTCSITNCVDNAICVYALSNHTSFAPVISYNARFRFVG